MTKARCPDPECVCNKQPDYVPHGHYQVGGELTKKGHPELFRVIGKVTSMSNNDSYDSRPETFQHSQRVGELMIQMIKEALDRSTCHDRSKTESPELEYFDEYTSKLKEAEYGSEEYNGFLEGLAPALDHHYAENRHHPQFFNHGVNGMTLVDLIEMIADWKAATERTLSGNLANSLEINRRQFEMSDQLVAILRNTAIHFGWIPRDTVCPCGYIEECAVHCGQGHNNGQCSPDRDSTS